MDNNEELLKLFNSKNRKVFGEIYQKLHKELILYASMLFRGTDIPVEDIVQDVFINIWSGNTNFNSLESIKAYTYVSVKNKFKNHLSHIKHVQSYAERQHIESQNYDIDIIETELYSQIDNTLKTLPKQYADVLRLYINGWKLADIAIEQNKSEGHIYKIKHEAIKRLKKNLSKDNVIIINILISIIE